jgi:hypothetical protein
MHHKYNKFPENPHLNYNDYLLIDSKKIAEIEGKILIIFEVVI